MTIQAKAIEQCFQVVVLFRVYKVFLTFDFFTIIHVYYSSNRIHVIQKTMLQVVFLTLSSQFLEMWSNFFLGV